MPQPASHLMIEFLSWIASQRRTYAQAMDAWRSSCPRHTVWEDAIAAGFIQIENAQSLNHSPVTLTPCGRSLLESVSRIPLDQSATPESHRVAPRQTHRTA